ncbi:ATP-binding protein [Micromonospora coxensis]
MRRAEGVLHGDSAARVTGKVRHGRGSFSVSPGRCSSTRPGHLRLWCVSVSFEEAPEFSKGALEALRQPLEHGRVQLARSGGGTEYPARTQLVLASNPCPCAKPAGDAYCECSPLARRRYLGRLSGPLLDRIDVQVKLLPVRAAELMEVARAGESSAGVAARVSLARRAAAARWAPVGRKLNAEIPGPYLRRPPWRLPVRDTAELRGRLDSGAISARGFDRIIRLAWTIADLDGRDRPGREDVLEAIQLRTGEGT